MAGGVDLGLLAVVTAVTVNIVTEQKVSNQKQEYKGASNMLMGYNPLAITTIISPVAN